MPTTEDENSGQTANPVGNEGLQRMVISVPNPATTLVLGSRRWDGQGYAGITGITTRHIMFKATDADATATIESPHQVVVHSVNSTFTAYSGSDMLLGSNAQAYLSAKDKVFIASGAASATHGVVAGWATPGPNISNPKERIATAVSEATDLMSTTATVLTLVGMGMGVVAFTLGKKAEWSSLIVGGIQLSLLGLSQSMKPDSKGETHIYGSSATRVSSTGKVEMVAMDSIALMCPQMISSFAGIQASMTALLACGITGGFTAGMTGFFKAEILGGKNVTISSKFGDVHVFGKAMNIGFANAGWPQADTQTIVLDAVKSVTMNVGGATPKSSLTVLEEGVKVNGSTHTLVAKDGIHMSAGPLGLYVGTDAISLTYTGPSLAQATIDAADLAYKTARTTAATVYQQDIWSARMARLAIETTTVMMATAKTTRDAAIKAASAALKAQLKLAKSMAAAVLRVKVDMKEAHISNGLATIKVDKLGNITIDSKGMPISIKCSPASSIEMLPAGVTIKGLTNHN